MITGVRETPKPNAVLLTLPDSTDLSAWFIGCRDADKQANELARPRFRGSFRVEVTYPELRGVHGVSWVYIGWRGRLRFAHQASQVMMLHAADIAEQDEVWAGKMRLGGQYQWVFATPLAVPDAPLPVGERLRYGRIDGGLIRVVPTWL